MRKMFASIILLFISLSIANAAWVPFSSSYGVNTSGNQTFTATATYYMSPTGSDSNNGTSPSTPWATPNHALNCGDVIIAAAGTYNGSFNSWGTVSNCPSTTAGIDGTGGVYFAVLLCGGSDVDSCLVNCSTGSCSAGHVGSGGSAASGATMNVNADNWAIEGWNLTGNGASKRGIQVDACLTQTTVIHHVAAINNVIFNSGQAFDPDECAYNNNVPGNGGDYLAFVGNIAQNTAQDTICLGSVDIVAPANSDTNAGTHVFVYGNFSYANTNSCASDVEDYLADTLDAHGYVGTLGFINNIGYDAYRYGWQLFYQHKNTGTTSTVIDVYNNTLYHNNTGGTSGSNGGEFNFQSTNSSLPYLTTLANNIGYSDLATGSSTQKNFAMVMGGVYNVTVGGAVLPNVFFGVAGSCPATCAGSDSVVAFNGGPLGTNTYENPSFNNTTDLLANQVGTPSCSGFVNVTMCAGYNANTQILTNPSIIYDLTPTASGTAGVGYQLPVTTCAPVIDYPPWLKGIVYLHWNGSTLTENKDLVTVPCGL